jgi:hypothetical protein
LGSSLRRWFLLPETWAAVRAARADRLQTGMNLAVGSALACIGLRRTCSSRSYPELASIDRNYMPDSQVGSLTSDLFVTENLS